MIEPSEVPRAGLSSAESQSDASEEAASATSHDPQQVQGALAPGPQSAVDDSAAGSVKWKHFNAQRIDHLMTATAWSLSLLGETLPKDSALREALGAAEWERLENERRDDPHGGWRKSTRRFSLVFRHLSVSPQRHRVASSVEGVEAPPKDEVDLHRNWAIKLVRGIDELKRDQLELGNYAKWLCVLSVVATHPTIFEARPPERNAPGLQTRRFGARGGTGFWPSKLSSQLKDLFDDPTRGSVERFARIDDVGLQQLLQWFNALKIRQGRPLTADSILERRVLLGPRPKDALTGFCQWLINGTRPPVLHHGDPATPPSLIDVGPLASGLEAECGEIRRRLQAKPSDSPVVNVICSDPELCRQLVAGVCNELESEAVDALEALRKPTVLYFDVRGDAVSILAVHDVLAALMRVFGLPFDLQSLRTSQRAFRDGLLEVRRACTVYPTIVVLDGVDEVEGPHAALLNVIRGSRWDELTRVLVQPDWSWAQQFGLAHVHTARVLVTSNVPMSGLEGWVTSSAVRLQSEGRGSSVRFPPPEPIWRRAVADPFRATGITERPSALIVMLAFAAAAPDGISYGALWRGFGYWLDIIKRDYRDSQRGTSPAVGDVPPDWVVNDAAWRAKADLSDPKAFAGLSTLFGDDVVRVQDEPLPWVTRERTRYEWQSSPEHWDPPWRSVDADRNYKLRFKTEALRTEFLRVVMTSFDAALNPQGALQPDGGWRDGIELGDRLYQRVNMAIAIESLAQATSQLRSPDSRESLGLMGSRRLIQAIYHLRAAGDIDIPLDGAAEYAAYLSIPKQKAKRFRYAFAFLFKRCLESGEQFKLARTHGRSDLKLALLALFLVSDVRTLEPWWHGGAYRPADFTTALERGVRQWESTAEHRGAELVPDILHSLAIAAVDAGQTEVAEWALAKFNVVDEHFRVAARALRDNRSVLTDQSLLAPAHSSIVAWEAGSGGAYAKLQFDFLDAQGRTEEALAHAHRFLERFGIHDSFWQELDDMVETFVRQSTEARRTGDRIPGEKASTMPPFSIRGLVDSTRLGKLVEDTNRRKGPARKQLVMSDLLSRYADVLGTIADRADRHGPDSRLKRLTLLMKAFAYFFIADRLRSGVAGKSGLGTAWAAVPAKPTRIYMRTCLSIARCLVELDDPPLPRDAGEHEDARRRPEPRRPLSRCAGELYECAKEWAQQGSFLVDLFVRHLSGHRRESLQSLLLMTALVRTWVVVSGRGEGHETESVNGRAALRGEGQAAGHERLVLPQLGDAVTYLQDADRLLNDMGAPSVDARRVWTERLTWLIGLAKQLHDDVIAGSGSTPSGRRKADPGESARKERSTDRSPEEKAELQSRTEQISRRLATVIQLVTIELARAQRLAGDSMFWKPLIRRQELRWERLRDALQ